MISIQSLFKLITIIFFITFAFSQATILKGPTNRPINPTGPPNISGLSSAVGFTGMGSQLPQNGKN
jgi:hypothetical protein